MRASARNKLIRRICQRIIQEAVGKGYADYRDKSYNPEHHCQITITIKELRVVGALAKFNPTPAQLRSAKRAREWQQHLTELDGMG